MRIISQDGKVDLPYEMSVVNIAYRNDKLIYATLAGCGEEENVCEMAKYSTREKAIKAMKMMREKYLSRMELEGGPTINGGYVQPNFWVLPKAFQFPKDDEVTV